LVQIHCSFPALCAHDFLASTCVTSSSSAQAGASEVDPNDFCGVTWLEGKRQWQAALHHQGRTIDMGLFPTPQEAAAACDAAALVTEGHHPRNFPTQVSLMMMRKVSSIVNCG